MIVKFFTRGTGGSSGVFNYLLKDKEQEDGLRFDAEVLRGDIENQAMLIDSLDFKQKYTSGCLSFTESADQVTQAQKEQLMDSFEETIRAGLDLDRVSVSWIEHRDKGRLELNFVYANVDLEHGRAFQPYVHSVDKRRVNAWKDMQNIEHGLSDPNDPANKRLMGQRDNLPRDVKEARQGITDALTALVAEGVITSRADVVQSLTSAGFEIARQTDKAISIKNPDPEAKRNIRLTGGLYERDFKFSREVQNTVTAASDEYRARATERYNAAKQLYDSEIERKRNYHSARHDKPRREQRAAAAAASNAPNRYKYSPAELFKQRPSPFNPGFRGSNRANRNDDRELYPAYSAADTKQGGQDSASHQIRYATMVDIGWRSSDGFTGARLDTRGVDGQQILKTDLHHSTAADQLRAEITNGQTITRSGTAGSTGTTRHDQAPRADARRQGRGYSDVEALITTFSRHEDAGIGEVTEIIRKLREYGKKSNERLAELAEISKNAHSNTGKVDRRAIQFRERTDSTRRAIEELSECHSTSRLSKARYSGAREQYSTVNERIEQVSEHTERNRAVTGENNRIADRNTGGIDGIKQIAGQVRKIIQAKAQEEAQKQERAREVLQATEPSVNIENTRSRSPRMGR